MAGIDVEISLRDDVSAALDRLAKAGADMTPAMRAIAGHLAAETEERFETERAPSGLPWKKSQRALDEGGQTLTLHGDLRSSITFNYGRDFAEAGPERSGGAGVYAAIHQFGGTIKAKNGRALTFGGRLVASVSIPARPYLGFTDADADFVVDELAALVTASMTGAGPASAE